MLLQQLTGRSCPAPPRRRPSSACSTRSRSSTAAAAPASPACWPAPASSAAAATPAAALPYLAACCRRQSASWTPPFDVLMPCYPYIACAAVPGWAVARRGRGPQPALHPLPPRPLWLLSCPRQAHGAILVSQASCLYFFPTLSAACLPPRVSAFHRPATPCGCFHSFISIHHSFTVLPENQQLMMPLSKPVVTHDCPCHSRGCCQSGGWQQRDGVEIRLACAVLWGYQQA